jgi:hypothetical protein
LASLSADVVVRWSGLVTGLLVGDGATLLALRLGLGPAVSEVPRRRHRLGLRPRLPCLLVEAVPPDHDGLPSPPAPLGDLDGRDHLRQRHEADLPHLHRGRRRHLGHRSTRRAVPHRRPCRLAAEAVRHPHGLALSSGGLLILVVVWPGGVFVVGCAGRGHQSAARIGRAPAASVATTSELAAIHGRPVTRVTARWPFDGSPGARSPAVERCPWSSPSRTTRRGLVAGSGCRAVRGGRSPAAGCRWSWRPPGRRRRRRRRGRHPA